LLTARLDRLGPAREVAQVGSVIGRGFSYGLLRDVAGMDDGPLQAALEKLAEADILLVQCVPPESDYRFKHALIQDADYENLLKSRRQVLHRRTGEVLRDQFAATAAAEPELLAHHLTQARLTEAAVEWWGTAGQRSLARSALLEASEQLKRALNQIATLPTTPALRREEIKLRVPFANVLALTGDLMGGKENYDRALAIYDPAEHRPLAARSGRNFGVTLLSFRSSCLWQLGFPAASHNDAERAVKNAREIGHAATLMYALSRASYGADRAAPRFDNLKTTAPCRVESNPMPRDRFPLQAFAMLMPLMGARRNSLIEPNRTKRWKSERVGRFSPRKDPSNAAADLTQLLRKESARESSRRFSISTVYRVPFDRRCDEYENT
jgi:tetratricopeptide (TPR) repeat protein